MYGIYLGQSNEGFYVSDLVACFDKKEDAEVLAENISKNTVFSVNVSEVEIPMNPTGWKWDDNTLVFTGGIDWKN